MHQVAQLAVAERSAGVVGFGVYCRKLSAEQMNFYRATFDYMKASNMDVTIFAKECEISFAFLKVKLMIPSQSSGCCGGTRGWCCAHQRRF